MDLQESETKKRDLQAAIKAPIHVEADARFPGSFGMRATNRRKLSLPPIFIRIPVETVVYDFLVYQ